MLCCNNYYNSYYYESIFVYNTAISYIIMF